MEPIRTCRKKDKAGRGRVYGVFSCSVCFCEFEARVDHGIKAKGICCKCSNILRGKRVRVHGHNTSNSRIYATWMNMKRRCYSPTEKEKKNYENIIVCDEWLSFVGFMSWAMGNGYNEKNTIDRRDSTGNYCPENCRFVDYNIQSANRRITGKNTSGFIGVRKTSNGKWAATVQWKQKSNHIGVFIDKIDAAKARDKYIIENKLPHKLNNII